MGAHPLFILLCLDPPEPLPPPLTIEGPFCNRGPMSQMDECLPEHCFYAFDTLYCQLHPETTPIEPEFGDAKYPLFVTWNTRSSNSLSHPRLRGCIGSFLPLDLKDGIQEYALISALHDHRFRPIQSHELRKLECCISLLTDFQDVPTYLDWTVGVHGIYITFPNPATVPNMTFSSADTTPSSSTSALHIPFRKKTPRSLKPLTATYLPDVAPAQGWDKIEAVDSAIRKAGWEGRITEDIRRSIKMRTYQSKTATVTWDDYWNWRNEKELQASTKEDDTI